MYRGRPKELGRKRKGVRPTATKLHATRTLVHGKTERRIIRCWTIEAGDVSSVLFAFADQTCSLHGGSKAPG
jgi:hypothetical protein